MEKPLLVLLVMALVPACASAPKPMDSAPSPASAESGQVSAKELFHEGDDRVSAEPKGISLVDITPSANSTLAPSKLHKPPGSAASSSPYQGFSYWIERLGRSDSHRVTASTTFREGHRIRFHVRSNRSGYLYVVTQGTSGRSAYLFPTNPEESEYIEANRSYSIPAHQPIVFDSHPGMEVVWLFLSKQPLPVGDREGGNSRPNSLPDSVVALNTCGSKDLLIESPELLQRKCGPKAGARSKDILVEDDAEGAEPAGYAVMPQDLMEQGAMLSLRLVLRHE